MNKCAWHKDDQPVDPDIGCEYCSTMLETKACDGCGKDFLDWEAKGFDDIIAAPYVSSSPVRLNSKQTRAATRVERMKLHARRLARFG